MTNFSDLTNRLNNINFAMEEIKTITHNGVIFPEIPEYVTKNKGIKLANKPLSDLAREMLFAWSTLNEKYANDKVYQKNFYDCLQYELSSEQKKLKFPADFKTILKQMAKIKTKYAEDKKVYNKIHKTEIDAEKAEKKAKYGIAKINGKDVEIGNVLIEGPRIFIGRGDCAFRGSWVYRVEPEDVKINSSKKIPCPIKGHHWGECSKKNTMSIATYTEYVGVNDIKINKAVWLSNKSDAKISSKTHIFDKAQLLEKNWGKVTKAIKKMYTSDDSYEKQVGCCAYLISVFGIRAGNSSGARNNGVVGASTLLIDNIKFLSGNKINLDFIGKDSMRFNETKVVEKSAYESLKSLVGKRGKKNRLFPNISSGDVNYFLQNINKKELPDLSNKTFRTFFGTKMVAEEVRNADWEDLSDKEFKNQYMGIVKKVALYLNHKKTVSKESMEKSDASAKAKLDKATEKLTNVKDEVEENVKKLQSEKKKLQSKTDAKSKKRIKEINQEIKEWKEWFDEENETFEQVKKEIQNKLENREINLSTSMNAYSNPKIVYSLCKTYDKDPKIIYSKAQKEQFDILCRDVDEDYWINYPNV